MKNWTGMEWSALVLGLLAALCFALSAVACGDAGDAVCTDCYDDESVQTTVQKTPADDKSKDPSAVKPTNDQPSEEPMCELSLAVGQGGDLEMWACYNDAYNQGNRAVKVTFDCWEGLSCDASFEAATPLNSQMSGCAFVVLTGHQNGVLRDPAGGWIYPADCQMYDGVVWQKDPKGGYLKWPPNPDNNG